MDIYIAVDGEGLTGFGQSPQAAADAVSNGEEIYNVTVYRPKPGTVITYKGKPGGEIWWAWNEEHFPYGSDWQATDAEAKSYVVGKYRCNRFKGLTPQQD